MIMSETFQGYSGVTMSSAPGGKKMHGAPEPPFVLFSNSLC